jgi:hypothetical protein
MKFTLQAFLLVFLLAAVAFAAGPTRESKGRRALPPKWPQSVTDVFFPDARDKLVGERPDYASTAKSTHRSLPTPGANASAGGGGGEAPAGGSGFAWSKLISAETIEDEIKSLQTKVSENVTTPAKFKGGGFKEGRRQFTELAFLFAIISQYDGEVRWKNNAGGVRDLMARAGFNCKVGTDASYNEAKLRKEDLEQLVRGGSISAPDANPDAKWDKIADRPPLMQRMEEAQQQRIAPATANAGEFKKNADVILREAELLAAIGQTIGQEGFEFSDDETYLGYAHQMRDAALEIVGAVKGKDYETARAASGKIEKACSSCHEGYRS